MERKIHFARFYVKVYKLCKRDGDRLISSNTVPELTLTYRLGKVTKPKVGYIYAYRYDPSLSYLKRLCTIYDNPKLALLECEAVVINALPLMYVSYYENIEKVKCFWEKFPYVSRRIQEKYPTSSLLYRHWHLVNDNLELQKEGLIGDTDVVSICEDNTILCEWVKPVKEVRG